MAHVRPDAVYDTTTSVGTGTITLAGAPPNGYKSLDGAGVATNDTFNYRIKHLYKNEWEVGFARKTGSNAFVRVTIYESSNSDALVDFSAGLKEFYVTSPGRYGTRETLTANTSYYVRANLGRVTLSNANPCVATTASSHSLQVDDPVVFTWPEDRQICTVTIASPGVFSATAHGFASNDRLTFATSGALPTGLTAGTTYFVIPVDADHFQVSASAGPGAAVNTSGSQSGTHFVYRVASLPTGGTNNVVQGQIYYVLSSGLSSTQFQFSLTKGGTAINTTGATQTGIFTVATGNDNNDGGAATRDRALLGLSHQTGVMRKVYSIDGNGFNLTCQLADSYYTEILGVSHPIIGVDNFNINGNGVYPTNVVIDGSTIDFSTVFTADAKNWNLRGLRIIGSSICLYVDRLATIQIGDDGDPLNMVDLQVGSGGIHINVQPDGHVFLSNCSISSGGGNCMYIDRSILQTVNNPLYVLNNPTFSDAFIFVGDLGLGQFNITIDGIATGKRYAIASKALLNTFGGGSSYFPGTVAGTGGATTDDGTYL